MPEATETQAAATPGVSDSTQLLDAVPPSVRMAYAGAIGLLCECSLKVGNSNEAEEIRDSIESAVADWCALTGWTMRRTLQRIEVFPTGI
ncbi:MAG: hypothetical protein Q7T53_03525 [Deltaproteobacteria bacterium]|nr:hypothetical protein [Deltaproteobacteria bacterium]